VNKTEIGRRGEALAEGFLKRKGYKILDRNWKGRAGEIDIVALDGKTVVFVEVKTRSSEKFGSPKDAVDSRKKKHLTNAAKEYLRKKRKSKKPARFDVVGISIKGETLFQRLRSPEIEHIENAFEVKE